MEYTVGKTLLSKFELLRHYICCTPKNYAGWLAKCIDI